MWDGIFAGSAVATLTGGLALVALRWSHNRSNQAFMVAFMGGMALRLIAVAGLSALILSFTEIHPISYIVSLVVVYLLFLGLEIFYALLKNSEKANGQADIGK